MEDLVADYQAVRGAVRGAVTGAVSWGDAAGQSMEFLPLFVPVSPLVCVVVIVIVDVNIIVFFHMQVSVIGVCFVYSSFLGYLCLCTSLQLLRRMTLVCVIIIFHIYVTCYVLALSLFGGGSVCLMGKFFLKLYVDIISEPRHKFNELKIDFEIQRLWIHLSDFLMQ